MTRLPGLSRAASSPWARRVAVRRSKLSNKMFKIAATSAVGRKGRLATARWASHRPLGLLEQLVSVYLHYERVAILAHHRAHTVHVRQQRARFIGRGCQQHLQAGVG